MILVPEGAPGAEPAPGRRGWSGRVVAAAAKTLSLFRRQPRWRKLLIVFGCLAALAAGIGYRWLGGEARAQYITVPVSRGSIVEAISATGIIEAQKSVGLNFEIGGKIGVIYVQPGDRVKAGQVLARLDTSSLEAAVAEAEANYAAKQAELQKLSAGPEETELAQAEANLIEAQSALNSAGETLKANQALFEGGFLTRADLDKSTAERDAAAAKLRYARAALEKLRAGTQPADLAAARAQVQGALAALQEARNNLDAAELRAPWDGFVTDVQGEVGQHISGGGSNDNTADGFISLLTSDLRLSVQVNEADIGRTKVGQKVTFTVNAYPERTFTGKVSRIAAAATTQSNVQLYAVEASVDDPDHLLKAGMSASVSIIVNEKEDVITIPQTAVTFAANNRAIASGGGTRQMTGGNAGGTRQATGGGRVTGTAPGGATGAGAPEQAENTEVTGERAAVLVLANGRPQVRRIVTGLSDETNVEVISGLEVGERVIIGTGTPGRQPATGQTTSGSSRNRSSGTRVFMGPPMMGR